MWAGDYSKLRLEGICDGFNVHWHSDGYYLSLQHVTCRELKALDELDMANLFNDYEAAGASFPGSFEDWVRERTDEPDQVDEWVAWCADCTRPHHEADLYPTNGNYGRVCESCLDDWYTCDRCDQRFGETTSTLYDTEVCQSCRDDYYSYCEGCDGYYLDASGCGGDHYEEQTCYERCSSPKLEFAIRNDGADPLVNDHRVKVTLPAGEISDEGIGAIATLIRNHGFEFNYETNDYVFDIAERQKWSDLSLNFAEALGNKWQAKDGNYTKRLSRYAYKTHGLKLPPALVSSVGNVGSDHSRAVDFEIEVTRDLNLPASDFANEESCWWGSYYHGRCTLKSNGGFGIRTFDTNGYVTGRVWVIPLRNTGQMTTTMTTPRRADACDDPRCCPQPETVEVDPKPVLVPTFETENPDAFIVFNGYQTLSGYAGARLLAHMAGMTYRKVTFGAQPMYVNSDAGYLVAPEEIAQHYTDGALRLDTPQHSDLYERERLNAALDATTESKELAHA